MPFDSKHLVRAVTTSVVITLFAVLPTMFAQSSEHLVSPTELQKAIADASQTRQQNRDTLNRLFSSERATNALQSAHINPEQLRSAVGTLSDEELAQMASRANKAQTDFAAGNMSDRDLLIILVAIAALILIIVAVR
jgi:hypothetical protein